jgi:hypothetical protein
MKKLPLGIQTFGKLIQGNYLYVDKTKELIKLVGVGFDVEDKNIGDYIVEDLTERVPM